MAVNKQLQHRKRSQPERTPPSTAADEEESESAEELARKKVRWEGNSDNVEEETTEKTDERYTAVLLW